MTSPTADDTGVDSGTDALVPHDPITAGSQADAIAPYDNIQSLWLSQDLLPLSSHTSPLDLTTTVPPHAADAVVPGQVHHLQQPVDYHHTLASPCYPSAHDVVAHNVAAHDVAAQDVAAHDVAAHAGPSLPAAAPADLPYACPYEDCSNRYRRQCDLDKHINNHTKRRRCELCDRGAAETKDLNRHMWTHHADEARRRGLPREEDRCGMCGYAGRKDNVKRHKDTLRHWDNI